MGYRDDPYWEDDEYSSDFGEGNNFEDDKAFKYFSSQQDVIAERGWNLQDLVTAWEVYKSDNPYYIFEDFLVKYSKGISDNVTAGDVIAKIFSKLSTDPIGAGLISKGVQGFTRDFLYDMFKGDFSNADQKLTDLDNLVANLGMYLAARGVSQKLIEGLQLGRVDPYTGKFIPDYTLMYQFSYVLKNQLSDIVWEGYSQKYTGQPASLEEYYARLNELTGGFHWNIRTWSYSKGGNTKDAPASGGWIKSKFGDYYIRKNLF